ncbi:MAG: hypothetical protein B0D91_01400 [Oceanospirillales bacterium LUC14_002_19_P2]|nr:MAG: hypothetical protein B0D91_01400 [Oceanospirillales bacterium LUC14_002_19_P2]
MEFGRGQFFALLSLVVTGYLQLCVYYPLILVSRQPLKYVQWPAQTLTNNTLRVCMVGKGPINRKLKALSGKKLSGKQVHVIYYEALKKTDLCHLAFINNSAAHQFHELIRLLNKQPVLTVSDIPAFASNGGMFELNESKDRIRLVVNLKAIRASGFLIGSQLLRMSRVIR